MPKKDYSQKKYEHPLRKKKQKNRLSKRSRGILATIVAIFVLGGSFYGLFLTPWLQVKSVQVKGTDDPEITRIVKDWLELKAGERWSWAVSKNNLFILDIKKLSQGLASDIYINSVEIEKKFPDKIMININRRDPVLTYNIDNNYFLIDKAGAVIEPVLEADKPNSIPLVRGTTTDALVVGSKSKFNSELVEFIDELSKEFPRYQESIHLVDFEHVPRTQEIKAYTSAGWYVLFDAQEELFIQLSNLNRALEENISPGELNNLQYIDVRIINYIYYK